MHSVKDSQRYGAVDEQRLARFEAGLGVGLPEEYRQFLLAHNGGKPVPSDFRVDDDVSRLHGAYGLHDGPEYCRIDEVVRVYRGRIPDDLLPFADDPGGNEVCIGLKGNRRGQVYFWDHETKEVIHVANSFNEFLDGLFEWIDPNEALFWKLARTNDLAAVKTMLQEGFDVETEDEHGRSLLEVAAIFGRLEMIQALIASGGRIRNARALAQQNECTDVVMYLDRLGTD